MDALGASEDDWNDYKWQLRHVRRNVSELDGLIELTADERGGDRTGHGEPPALRITRTTCR
jgi:L-lysine 2,3-aminomutase